jgi:D-alanine-D-alanine ligase
VATWPVSVVVLYTQVDALVKGEAIDLISDQETARVAHEIASGLAGLAHRVALAGVRHDVARALAPYPPSDWVVFNLCESLGGDSALEATVPELLEARGYTYTGAPAAALALCLDKAHTKDLLARHGIHTPRYAVVSSPGEPCHVPLPALVKPLAEDASVGITYDSVVRDEAALARQVAYIVERYRQPALVEEFIAGREFNAAIWGDNPPQPLPLSEICYDDFADPLQRLLTYESKWVEDSFAYHHTNGICPARVDDALRERLLATALAAYRLTGCRGYARVDMRERDGVPYVLEVNPNPSLASEGGFVRAARAAGYDQAHMAERIVGFALERATLAEAEKR